MMKKITSVLLIVAMAYGFYISKMQQDFVALGKDGLAIVGGEGSMIQLCYTSGYCSAGTTFYPPGSSCSGTYGSCGGWCTGGDEKQVCTFMEGSGTPCNGTITTECDSEETLCVNYVCQTKDNKTFMCSEEKELCTVAPAGS